MVKYRTNRILQKNKAGKKALGLSLVYPSAEAIELVGLVGGFDFINLDGEHGLFTPDSVDAMCRIADGFGLTTIARVPSRDPSVINQYLDRGVIGILGPHVETADEARRLVDACRFTPDGERSWGGGRGTFYNKSSLIDQPGSDRSEYMAKANSEMLVMAQLESAKAFGNLEDIMSVPGIDVFAWGTKDLAQSMGFPGKPDHEEVQAEQSRIGDIIQGAGRLLITDSQVALSLVDTIAESAERFRNAHS